MSESDACRGGRAGKFLAISSARALAAFVFFLPPEEKEWVADDTSEHIGEHQTIRLCCFRARHLMSRAWPCSLLFPRALSLHPALFATIPPNHSACSQSHAPPSFLRRPPPSSARRPLRTPGESGLAGRLQRAGSSGSG